MAAPSLPDGAIIGGAARVLLEQRTSDPLNADVATREGGWGSAGVRGDAAQERRWHHGRQP